MDNTYTPTPFDAHLQSPTLQLLKTAIPYLPPNRQRTITTVVKMMELSMANSMFDQGEPDLQMCEGMNTSSRIAQMLEAIRPLCSEGDQANIDLISNALSMYELYGGMFRGGDET
jgi:hypothetical protein